MSEQRVPQVFVAIGYDDVYDDFTSIKATDLLEGIPTVTVLKYVTKEYARVFYAQSDKSIQRKQVYDFCINIPAERKRRVWDFLKKSQKGGHPVFLYGAMGCWMLYRLALQTYTSLEEDDDEELCKDEYEPVFKALLYCNKLWTDQQLSKDDFSLPDIALKMDIPVVEGKQYKDFRPQLYKADRFFSFCESDKTFNNYLPYFYHSKGVKNWGEYVLLLFNIYSYSIKNYILPKGNEQEQQFLSQFVIDENDVVLKTIWDVGHKGVNYLRDHFLFGMPSGDYLLLDANLLIDKLYQGLKFDFFNTIQANGLLNARGKPYKDLPEFNSTLGTVFSERHLLYELLKKTYHGGNAVHFTGEELKAAGITGEPDYYLRIDNTLFLIEYKDLLFPDALRYSDNVKDIKDGIIDRLCLDDGKKRKGGGQLLYTIDRILNHGLMDNLDEGVKGVSTIFPLLVTTDRAFSAMGVNNVVIEAFDRLLKQYDFNMPVMIYVPVIINLDSLILLSYRLHKSKLQLGELLVDYIKCNWKNLSSFDNYIYDECKENEQDRAEAIEYLFTEMVAKIGAMTNGIK